MTAPLSDLVVLEASGDVATRYCGKLFAEHGARVIQAYRPDDRHVGYGGAASRAYAAWLDDGKERGTADGILPDLVIAGQYDPDIRAAETLVARFSRRPLLLALTWFGPTGPYAGWTGSDGVIQAMTGIAYAIGPAQGPPNLPQGHAPQIVAGATGLIVALSALIGRRNGQRIDRVDTNVLEAHLCFAEHSGPGFFKGGPAAQRRGVNRYLPVYPQTIFPAEDGWIGVTALTPQQWQGLCALIGLPDLAKDPDFATTDKRLAACDRLDAILGPALRRHKAAYLLEEGQRRRVPMAPVPTMEQVLATPHWRARDSFRAFPDGFEGPAMPFRLHARSSDLAESGKRPGGEQPGAKGPDDGGPLAGLRVLDLSMGWSGPLTGRHFADLGAEVIKVEGCAHIDWWRGWNALEAGDPPPYEMRANFNAVNRNKRGITLDLTSQQGGDLLRRLAADADLLIENYAPGVLDRLGYSAASLGALNPRLVYISMGAFGSAGPWSGFRAYGSTTEQASGMPFLHGAADWPPAMQHTAYGDPVAGIYAAVASLIALYGREQSGGVTIDLSQVECLFQLAADGIVAQSATGAAPPRTGSQSATSAWRGCVACDAPDTWLAVDLHDRDRLRQAGITLPVGGADQLAIGGADQPAIGAALAAWAEHRTPERAAAELQASGIAAGAVTPAHRLLDDPHLAAIGFWRRAERRYVGTHLVPKPPFAVEGEAPPLRRPSPTLGEHNAPILHDLLGLTPTSIAQLEHDGIIGTKAT
jgi:crotonobetainyl-CoA:carnitine CoA-transferase CaiB-like acyl-CoA transferase